MKKWFAWRPVMAYDGWDHNKYWETRDGARMKRVWFGYVYRSAPAYRKRRIYCTVRQFEDGDCA